MNMGVQTPDRCVFKIVIIMSLPTSGLDNLFAPDTHTPLGSLHQEADPGTLWFLAGLPGGREQETGGAGGERGQVFFPLGPSHLIQFWQWLHLLGPQLLPAGSGAHSMIITPFLPSAFSEPGEETKPAIANPFTLHSAHLREQFLPWIIQGKHCLLLDPE